MPPRPDFVDQAHRQPAPPRNFPSNPYGVLPEPPRPAPRPRWQKLDELAALVITFIAASFIFAHLLVAVGVGMAGCAGG